MTLFEQLAHLTTEAINPETAEIDVASTHEIVELLHRQDKIVANAVASELGYISQAVDLIEDFFGGKSVQSTCHPALARFSGRWRAVDHRFIHSFCA